MKTESGVQCESQFTARKLEYGSAKRLRLYKEGGNDILSRTWSAIQRMFGKNGLTKKVDRVRNGTHRILPKLQT